MEDEIKYFLVGCMYMQVLILFQYMGERNRRNQMIIFFICEGCGKSQS